MESVAQMLQHNPLVVLVLLVGLPSLTWAAAYGRRPSRARGRVAVAALAVTKIVAIVAIVEALRSGAPWWPPLVLALFVGIVWTLLVLVPRARR